MRAAAMLLAVGLLVPAVAGCQVVDRARNILDRDGGNGNGRPPVLVELANETRAFEPAPPQIPPTGPESLRQSLESVDFNLTAGTVELNMTVVVTFTAPTTPPGLPQTPQGEVLVRFLGPDNTGSEQTTRNSGTFTEVVPSPAAGSWRIELEAAGQGSIAVSVQALVPPP